MVPGTPWRRRGALPSWLPPWQSADRGARAGIGVGSNAGSLRPGLRFAEPPEAWPPPACAGRQPYADRARDPRQRTNGSGAAASDQSTRRRVTVRTAARRAVGDSIAPRRPPRNPSDGNASDKGKCTGLHHSKLREGVHCVIFRWGSRRPAIPATRPATWAYG